MDNNTVVQKGGGLQVDFAMNSWRCVLDGVLIHQGNDDVLRTFVLVQCCHEEHALHGLYGEFPILVPYPPFHHAGHPSLVHVSAITGSLHLPHACVYRGMERLAGMEACVPTAKGIRHNPRNLYLVHNTTVWPAIKALH